MQKKKLAFLFESRQQLFQYAKHMHWHTKDPENMDFPYLEVEEDGFVIFYCITPSDAFISSAMEELINAGYDRFVRIGTCGSLQENVKIGDLVIPNSAIKGDGVSDYYIPSEYPAVCTDNPQKYADVLGGVTDCHIGNIYTSTARYKQNYQLTMNYAKFGTMAIDMETSSLFSVSIHMQVKAIAVLVVTDSLINDKAGNTSDIVMQRIVFPTINRSIKSIINMVKNEI